jgi:hypothetical protein
MLWENKWQYTTLILFNNSKESKGKLKKLTLREQAHFAHIDLIAPT